MKPSCPESPCSVATECTASPGSPRNSQPKRTASSPSWTEDRAEAIIVRADRDKLGLHRGANTVNVGPDRPGLRVLVDVYARTQPRLPEYYCNDVRLPEDESPAHTLEAISGTLLITLGEPGDKAEGKPPSSYHATVTLRDVVFRRPDGTTVSPKRPISLQAFVGLVVG